jgi:hypothetical protein
MRNAGRGETVGTPAPPGRRQPWRALPLVLALAVLMPFAGTAFAAAPATLALLVPDMSATTLQRPEISAWIDAVREQGYEVTLYSNAQLLQDGAGAALKVRGLIVPDQSQTMMGDELVAALKN